MTETATSPALDGRPVIIVHLAAEHAGTDEQRTVCTGDRFRDAQRNEYRNTPRVLCEACRRGALR